MVAISRTGHYVNMLILMVPPEGGFAAYLTDKKTKAQNWATEPSLSVPVIVPPSCSQASLRSQRQL